MLAAAGTLQKPYNRFSSRLIHPIRNSVEVAFEQVSVRIQCHRGRGMSEHALHRLGISIGTDRDAGRSVAEVVRGELRERFVYVSCPPSRRPEPTGTTFGRDLVDESVPEDELVPRFPVALVGQHVG